MYIHNLINTARRIHVSQLLLLFTIVFLFACKDNKELQKEQFIGVSIEPQRYFAEQIIGKCFQVISMVPAGYSPENFDPSPNQLVKLSDSRLFFKVGNLGFENTWFNKIQENYADWQVFNLADAVESQQDDPHIWTSPKNARRFCQYMCNVLCRIDSTNAAIYRKNTDSLLVHIEAVDAEIQQILDSVSCRTFLIAHPALSYFARDYGLCQLSIETEGKEASVQDMQNLVRQCKEKQVKVILVQPEFNKSAAESLAKEINADIVEINPLNYEWDKEMINIAKAIRDGGKM